MNHIAEAYFEGIINKCAEYGVDPEWMVKNAGPSVALELGNAARHMKPTTIKAPKSIDTPAVIMPKWDPEAQARFAEVMREATAAHNLKLKSPTVEVPPASKEPPIPPASKEPPIPPASKEPPAPPPEPAKTTTPAESKVTGETTATATEGGAEAAPTRPVTFRESAATPKNPPVVPAKPAETKTPAVAGKETVALDPKRREGLIKVLMQLGLIGGAGYGTYKGIGALGDAISKDPDLQSAANIPGDFYQDTKNFFSGRDIGYRPPESKPAWGKPRSQQTGGVPEANVSSKRIVNPEGAADLK